MTVDKLDRNKILITLCTKEMQDFLLDYNTISLSDINSGKVLRRLLRLACFKTETEIRNKTVFMETLPLDNGCMILLTIYEKKDCATGTYKMKKNSANKCYKFSDISCFLDAIERLNRQNICCNKSSVYLYNDEYYLIFDYPSLPKKYRILLSEYGTVCKNQTDIARIKEYGKTICSRSAVTVIGKYL